MNLDKIWINKIPDREILYEFISKGAFSPLLAQILINKGFTDIHSAYTFLCPKITDFSNPFSIPEMDLAVKRIALAIKNKEKIGIYGDSDADGIIGTFVLYDFLKNFIPSIEVLIPSKEKEGYGFHAKFLPYFKEKGVKLIITVDVGISAEDTVNQAKALGLEVIITDHHEIKNRPQTIVVTGKLTPCDSDMYHLCGAGVVFTLIRGLRSYLYKTGFFKDKEPPKLRKYLELVSLATLADMVPLKGENRIITYFGFRDLVNPSFISTKVLLETLNITYKLSEEDIYYKIIPKINAAGRLGKPYLAFNFLCAKDYQTAKIYLEEIEKLNSERKEIESEILKEIENKLTKEKIQKKFLCLDLEDVSKGLLGLIANKIKNIYHIPVLVISFKNGIGYGSIRSPKEIDFFDIMDKCKDLLIGFGGHKYALGFTIEEKNLSELKSRLDKILDSFTEKRLKEVIYIDAETRISELIHPENQWAFAQFPPYGEEHQPPTLLLKNFKIYDFWILKDKHSKLILKERDTQIQAICFNKIVDKDNIKLIAGMPYINPFNETLEIRITDVR